MGMGVPTPTAYGGKVGFNPALVPVAQYAPAPGPGGFHPSAFTFGGPGGGAGGGYGYGYGYGDAGGMGMGMGMGMLPGMPTPDAARSEEMVDDFGMHIENTLSESRLLLQRVEALRKRLTLKMARARNETLKASMQIQLVTACMAACSMISGWFGMNLDNGACGPDGCHDAAADDHGYTNFRLVVCITTGLAVMAGLLLWWRISRMV